MRTTRVGRRAALAVAALAAPLVSAPRTTAEELQQFVLSPEGNHLWAYHAATGERQLLARAQNGEDPGTSAPNDLVRDINGQICVSPDGHHVITGEDTVVPPEEPGSGESSGSHDPRIAGWGWFEISGAELGELQVDQVGKLAPEAGTGPGYTGDPDNYGCGFLDQHRLFTSAIGNTLPGEPANGQLFLWFGPFEQGFRQQTDPDSGVGFFVGEVGHCQIDDTLATAGGIAVSEDGDVYVAANRPTELPAGGDPSAIWRYSGDWPRSLDECTPQYVAENITKTAVIPSIPGVPADPLAPTPSAVVISPDDTLYVSSVFSGTVSEFSLDGTWMRDLYPLSPVAPRTGPTGNTPFGLAMTADGALWIADLGIVTATPAPGQGSLIRLPLGEAVPLATTIQDGLTFPDGLGVYTPSGQGKPAARTTTATPEARVAGAQDERLPATGGLPSLALPALLAGAFLLTRRFA